MTCVARRRDRQGNKRPVYRVVAAKGTAHVFTPPAAPPTARFSGRSAGSGVPRRGRVAGSPLRPARAAHPVERRAARHLVRTPCTRSGAPDPVADKGRRSPDHRSCCPPELRPVAAGRPAASGSSAADPTAASATSPARRRVRVEDRHRKAARACRRVLPAQCRRAVAAVAAVAVPDLGQRHARARLQPRQTQAESAGQGRIRRQRGADQQGREAAQHAFSACRPAATCPAAGGRRGRAAACPCRRRRTSSSSRASCRTAAAAC
jgi:hypothetical protein